MPPPPRSPQTRAPSPPRAPRLPPLRLSPGTRSVGSTDLDRARTRSGLTLPPFVRWDKFMAGWRWRHGEHLTTVGPTGSGKTVLNRYLLRRRKFVVVLGIKNTDTELYGPFQADGYKLVRRFDIDHDSQDDDPRILFAPTTDKHGAEARKEKTKKFRQALNDIDDVRVRPGQESWTVYADDVRYMSDQLGLRADFEEIWIKGRSEGLTMVASSQEPVDIPVMAYGQASHLFLFKMLDKRRADRMAELTGVNREVARDTVLQLPDHEFLYINKSSGEMLRSKVIR
jgi:hypothetical protein